MEILNFREHMQGEKTLATFDLYFGPQWGMTLHRIRLVQGKKGPFIALPCYCEEYDGKKNWKPYLEFSKEREAAFDAKVFELLRNYIQLP